MAQTRLVRPDSSNEITTHPLSRTAAARITRTNSALFMAYLLYIRAVFQHLLYIDKAADSHLVTVTKLG